MDKLNKGEKMEIDVSSEALDMVSIATRKKIGKSVHKNVRFADKYKMATNGHILVVAKRKSYEPKNETFRFSNMTGKKEKGVVTFRGKKILAATDGLSGTAEYVEEKYPGIESAIGKPGRESIVIGIDAKLLLKLAKVVSPHNCQVFLDIEVCEKKAVPSGIVVSGLDSSTAGVIMPLGVGGESPLKEINEIINRK